jgi:DNA-binding transcriptional regulator YdaS (Cro superfamily)
MGESKKPRGLTSEQWAVVRERYEAGETVTALSESYGIRRATIADRAKRERWIAPKDRKSAVAPPSGALRTAQLAPIDRPTDGSSERSDDELTDEEWESPPPRASSAPKGTNWFAERDLYVTGNESYADIAKRLGLNEGSVNQVATDREHIANNGKTWAEHRTEFREDISRETLEREKETQVLRTLTVNAAQRVMAEDLVNAAFPPALAALSDGTLEPRERVKLALAALALQRRIHGLDKVPVRLELTGKDGGKIEHDVMLESDISDEAIELAERALYAIIGDGGIGECPWR